MAVRGLMWWVSRQCALWHDVLEHAAALVVAGKPSAVLNPLLPPSPPQDLADEAAEVYHALGSALLAQAQASGDFFSGGGEGPTARAGPAKEEAQADATGDQGEVLACGQLVQHGRLLVLCRAVHLDACRAAHLAPCRAVHLAPCHAAHLDACRATHLESRDAGTRGRCRRRACRSIWGRCGLRGRGGAGGGGRAGVGAHRPAASLGAPGGRQGHLGEAPRPACCAPGRWVWQDPGIVAKWGSGGLCCCPGVDAVSPFPFANSLSLSPCTHGASRCAHPAGRRGAGERGL